MDGLRTIVSAKDVNRAVSRVRDRSGANSREEEEPVQMGDLREKGQEAFQEVAGRVRIALRAIGAVRVLVWAAAAISAVASATAAELADREVDPEITDRAKASLRMLRQRIRKSGAMMKSGAQAIRREISVRARTISMRRMRQQGIVPASLSSLNRKKRKLSRK